MSGCCLTPRGKLGSLCDDATMYVVTTCLLREYTTNELDGMEIQVIHLKSFEVQVEFYLKCLYTCIYNVFILC